MKKEIDKINFHDQQLLTAEDFQKEQEYHTVMRRLHNSAIHDFGIVRGLDVEITANSEVIKVTQGLAIVSKFDDESVSDDVITYEAYCQPVDEDNSDSSPVNAFHKLEGYELYLNSDSEVNINTLYSDAFGSDTSLDTIYLYMVYDERIEIQDPDKGDDELYIHEEPCFKVSAVFDDTDKTAVLLAKIEYDANSQTVKTVIKDERIYSGLFIKKASFNSLRFKPLVSEYVEIYDYYDYPYIEGIFKNSDNVEKSIKFVSNGINFNGRSGNQLNSFDIEGSLTTENNLNITGKLHVKGNSQNISSTILGKELVIKDDIIVLNQKKVLQVPDDIAGIEIYRGTNQDKNTKILWEKNISDNSASWQVYALNTDTSIIEKGKLAFGIEELRTGENSDKFHNHKVLVRPVEISPSESPEIVVQALPSTGSLVNKINIGASNSDKDARLLVDGSIKTTQGILFEDGTILDEPIKPVSISYTKVIQATGDIPGDTNEFISSLESNSSILIIGDLVLDQNEFNLSNINNLEIVGSENSSLEIKNLSGSIFKISNISAGECNNIILNNLNIRSNNTLLSITSGSDVNELVISNCSNSVTGGSQAQLLNTLSCSIKNANITGNKWYIDIDKPLLEFSNSNLENIKIQGNSFEDLFNRVENSFLDISNNGTETKYYKNIKILNNHVNNLNQFLTIYGYGGYNLAIEDNEINLIENNKNIISIIPDGDLEGAIKLLSIINNKFSFNSSSGESSMAVISMENITSSNVFDNSFYMNDQEHDIVFNIEQSVNFNIAHNIIKGAKEKANEGTANFYENLVLE